MTVTEDALRGYELVVGLEVHVELATATKLFSASPNRFGDEPNTNIDPVTLGLPGALPVLNRQAVELAMRIGLALNCTVQAVHVPPQELLLSRHAEGVPDQPVRRAAQRRRVAGAGRRHACRHRAGAHRGGHRQVDPRRRLGRPDPRQRALADRLQPGRGAARRDRRAGPTSARPSRRASTSTSCGRSSSRSVRRTPRWKRGRCASTPTSASHAPGTPLGTRCEIKNLNSVRSLGRAIEYEARRQVVLVEAGEAVHQETRHWDETDGRTHTLRSKEDADDYRYFLEPDLVPLDPDPAWIERVRSELPMLPAERRRAARRRHRRSCRQRGRDGRRRPRPGLLRARRA